LSDEGRGTAESGIGARPGPSVRLTISLVTFNGMRWLPGCIRSVRSQDVDRYELIVHDNASTDGSREWLRELAASDPRVRLIESAQNLGFAAAHNRVIAMSSGDFILLLNQDIELDPGFLRHAVTAFARGPDVGSVQGRLRSLGADGTRTDILDSTGLAMSRDRRTVSRGQGGPDGPDVQIPGPVFGADGPAPVYRRSALLDARLPRHGGGWEILDEDFFMYKEDVDLAWRLRLLGWTAWYEPAALAWHARGAGGAPVQGLWAIARTNRALPRRVRMLSWRNQRLMQVKNEALGPFLRDLPRIARREILSLGYMLLADPLSLAALASLARHLPWAMRKRMYLRQRCVERSSTSGRWIPGVDP
jgi:GT2 family glycosyltransferase